MKVKLRAKAGQPLQIFDENGKEIEGLAEFHLRGCDRGKVPEVLLRIRGVEVQVDAEAEVEKVPPAPAVKPETAPASED